MRGIALWATIKTALALDTEIPGLAIHISVGKDGSVALYGDVHNVYVRERVGEVVAKVDGVKHLTNYLTVGRTAEPPERALLSPEDEKRLAHLEKVAIDALVQPPLRPSERSDPEADLTAWVTPTATAVLEGRVDTLAQKAQAEESVRKIHDISGVVNRIDCAEEEEFPESPPVLAGPIRRFREAWAHSDARVLFDAAGLLAAGVTPRREGERLVLEGDVDNFATKERAEELARYVYEGEVDNQLTVGRSLPEKPKIKSDGKRAPHYPEEVLAEPRYAVKEGLPLGSNVAGQDELQRLKLQKTLQEEIEEDPTLHSESDIVITVDLDGTVYLNGDLASEKARRRLEEMAWRTDGITDVKNALNVAVHQGS